VQTCIWPSWCHCHSLSLASVKSRLVLSFWYRLTRVVPDKGQLHGCVCVRYSIFWRVSKHKAVHLYDTMWYDKLTAFWAHNSRSMVWNYAVHETRRIFLSPFIVASLFSAWTASRPVKAVVLTCTNGVSANHLPVIVASDRPWTTLSTWAH